MLPGRHHVGVVDHLEERLDLGEELQLGFGQRSLGHSGVAVDPSQECVAVRLLRGALVVVLWKKT